MNYKANIRLACEEDAEGIVNAIRSGFDPSLLDLLIYGCPGIAQYTKYQIGIPKGLSEILYVVAEIEDGIAGCIELRRLTNALFLNYISILHKFRHRRLAKQLLKASIDHVRNPEHQDMFLDVLDRNSVAVDWYQGLGFEPCYSTDWWDIPLGHNQTLENIRLSGYPQAEVVHSEFGFSQFTLITAKNQYQIGRIGQKWFRLTQKEALADPAVLPALWRLERKRHALAIVPRSGVLSPLANARLLAQTHRMRIDLDTLMETLSRERD